MGLCGQGLVGPQKGLSIRRLGGQGLKIAWLEGGGGEGVGKAHPLGWGKCFSFPSPGAVL